MKKKELVQRVMDGAGLKFGDRTVAIDIASVFNTVVGQLFLQDPNQFSVYAKRVTLTVVNRVASLDFPIIQTKTNANGVLRIMPTGAEGDCCPDKTVFYPAPSYALNSSVEANRLANWVFYTVTAPTVRFNDSLPKEVTALLADVVLEFQGYGDDDYLPLPQGVAQMIIDQSIIAAQNNPAYKNIYKPTK